MDDATYWRLRAEEALALGQKATKTLQESVELNGALKEENDLLKARIQMYQEIVLRLAHIAPEQYQQALAAQVRKLIAVSQ